MIISWFCYFSARCTLRHSTIYSDIWPWPLFWLLVRSRMSRNGGEAWSAELLELGSSFCNIDPHQVNSSFIAREQGGRRQEVTWRRRLWDWEGSFVLMPNALPTAVRDNMSNMAEVWFDFVGKAYVRNTITIILIIINYSSTAALIATRMLTSKVRWFSLQCVLWQKSRQNPLTLSYEL